MRRFWPVLVVAVLLGVGYVLYVWSTNRPYVPPPDVAIGAGSAALLEQSVSVKIIVNGEAAMFVDGADAGINQESVIVRGALGSTHEVKIVTTKKTTLTTVRIDRGEAVPNQINFASEPEADIRVGNVRVVGASNWTAYVDGAQTLNVQGGIVIQGSNGSSHEVKIVTKDNKTVITNVKLVRWNAVPSLIDLNDAGAPSPDASTR